MNRLSISLLGTFQVSLAGEPVFDFASDKVRALLAYLAVEAERAHRRQTLAGLLWPDFPERSARTNLRNALAKLRRAIGDRQVSPPWLQVTPQTIQFNRASDYWLDVTTFSTLLATNEATRPAIASLEAGVALYQGPFLEGFAIADSVPFEEWLLLKREALSRQLLAALHRLADAYEQRGAYEQALVHAWRQVELEPYHEEGQQQVMRLLALAGRRSEALAQYETCRQVLADELGVDPSAKTAALVERIREGELSRGAEAQRRRGELATAPVAPPPFLSATSPQPSPPAPFVPREDELAQLDRFLDLALAGQGRVVFVTGEAGSGKTALVQEFARRAQERHADLVVAGGNCNAYTGVGDPYLPFREILRLLTGDIEAKWAAGTISQRQAHRLWNALPVVGQALVESGPDLIDSLVSGQALLARATTAAPQGAAWLDRLQGVTAQKQEPTRQVEQRYFFKQYADVLQTLARRQPLLLMLEDLHWVDSAHLERGLALLVTLPDSRERAERELALQITLGVPLAASKGYANQAVQEVYIRAQALCQRLGPPDVPILRALASVFIVRAELEKAHELLSELLSQAQRSQVPEHLVEAHYGLGSVSWWMGKLVPARGHLEQAMALYDPERHRVHTAHYAQDPGVICRIWLAMVLWYLGYPDQAVRCGREGLALARELDHPLSYAYALAIYSRLQQCLREPHGTLKYAEQAIAVATEYEFAFWASIGKVFRGWALAELGQPEAGLGQILEGISGHLNTGAAISWPWFLGLAASVYGQLGKYEAGLAALDKALTLVAETEERVCEAELVRLRGELLLSQGAQEHQAEACFLQAIEVARFQGAKSLELRAATSLSRLWQGQGKKEEARQMLAEIYDWFGEGFDAADLKEAKALLEALA